MDKKLDAKIKQILQENDDIVVPRNISKGIDETLKSLSNKKTINKKKVIAAASVIIFLSITPLGIKALKDMFYTYIPSTGNIISTDSTIYLLEKTINKKIGSRKVTLKELSYDPKNKMIIVSVEGNGQLPSNEATIKINKYKLKSSTCNITKLYDTRSYASWSGNYFFEYDKKYNEKNVELEFTLDNGNKAIFNCKLSKAKRVNNISELGYSAFNKNIEITAIVNEENNKCIIEAKGKGAHAAYPEGGNNALTGILTLLSSMPFADSEGFEKLCGINKLLPHGDYKGEAIGVKMADEVSGELTLSFTIFEYTTTGLKGTFDCRAPLCANDENLRDVVAKNLNNIGVILEPCNVFEGHYVDENSDFVQTLLRCYEMYSGKKGECIAIGGGTYVHHIKNGVAFGCTMPGTDNNMHGNDEFAVIDELILSAKIFTQAIIELCK